MARNGYTHGLEVEQFPADSNGIHARSTDTRSDGIPSEIPRTSDNDNWHRDPSGPQETDYGPGVHVKTLFNRFKRDCTVDGELRTWNWHNEHRGDGAGSHVHLHCNDEWDDSLEAWTVTYNTFVELTPVLAPFFCADWTNGFRNSVTRWASPQLTRYSQDSIEARVQRGRASRSYNSITFNPGAHDKPVTFELRLNEAHPAFSLVGLLFLRRLSRRCVKGGWSPKLVDHHDTLQEMYNVVYEDAQEMGLIRAMQQEMDIEFQEGRGIPKVEENEFDSMWDLLLAILGTMGTDTNNYKDRIKHLVKNAPAHDVRPEDMGEELWTVDEDTEFWQMVDERSFGLAATQLE